MPNLALLHVQTGSAPGQPVYVNPRFVAIVECDPEGSHLILGDESDLYVTETPDVVAAILNGEG